MQIYTGIASGYNFDSDMEGKIDYHEANSKFDNLINTINSKETRKDVALRLLTYFNSHPTEMKRIIIKLKLERFTWLIDSATVFNKRYTSEEIIYKNLASQLVQGSQNPFYQLIYGQYKNPFNLNTLSSIKANRIGFSDMVKVEYTSEDAFITKETLDLLSEAFLKKYKTMKIGEVNNVVKYFNEQTALALGRLETAELALKSFKTENRVINYYEQTKYIADQKEGFDQQQSQLQMELQGYKSALLKIENKLSSRTAIQLKSDEVLKARNNLSNEFNTMGLELVKGNNVSNLQNDKIEELKKDLKNNIQGLYDLNNSIEGVPGKNLLDQWLALTVSVEEGNAKLKVLEKNKSEFEKIYNLFSPMGSDLTKLERDVDVAEKEYLNLLHNLNQAKLRERNLVVTENISVTDPPEMPAVPNSSKRLILIIAAAFSCFLLSIIMLVLKELMDDSISNPLRFFKTTGIKTATAFVKEPAGKNVDLSEINKISIERWILSLIDIANQSNNKLNIALAIPFHKSEMDYKKILTELVSSIKQLGFEWQLNESNEEISKSGNHIILANTPNREFINKEILESCQVIYLFVNASQKMDEYQQNLLDNWKLLKLPIQAILINTKIQYLESFLGELPKKRTWLRKKVKDVVRRYSK